MDNEKIVIEKINGTNNYRKTRKFARKLTLNAHYPTNAKGLTDQTTKTQRKT